MAPDEEKQNDDETNLKKALIIEEIQAAVDGVREALNTLTLLNYDMIIFILEEGLKNNKHKVIETTLKLMRIGKNIVETFGDRIKEVARETKKIAEGQFNSDAGYYI